ncbi:Acyltransferase-like protein [Porphyridium purpureum]|uniref:Acyltransferase-like protein n=1 Tax=Porphyridium purpureum TaxID=35688 RepID=A0A5J4YXU4_PORPP|nr:Acyltransferase-like protein [Porphyridium purpureum]|eukprot:POR9110..scf209_3
MDLGVRTCYVAAPGVARSRPLALRPTNRQPHTSLSRLPRRVQVKSTPLASDAQTPVSSDAQRMGQWVRIAANDKVRLLAYKEASDPGESKVGSRAGVWHPQPSAICVFFAGLENVPLLAAHAQALMSSGVAHVWSVQYVGRNGHERRSPSEEETRGLVTQLAARAVHLIQEQSERLAGTGCGKEGAIGASASKITILGESFGAVVAMLAATELESMEPKPLSLHRLVLVNSASALLYQPWLRRLASVAMPTLDRVRPLSTGMYPLATFVLWRILVDEARLRPELVPARGMPGRISVENASLVDTIGRIQAVLAAEADIEHAARSIQTPTLLVGAAKDALFDSVREAQRLGAVLPSSRVQILEHSAHACLLEDEININSIFGLSESKQEARKEKSTDRQTPEPGSDGLPSASRDTLGYGVDPDFRLDSQAVERGKLLLNPWRSYTRPVFLGTENLLRMREAGFLDADDGAMRRRPILFVGNHTVHGILDMPLLIEHLIDAGVTLRPLAHPAHFELFSSLTRGGWRDVVQSFGAVRATPRNYFRLLKHKQAILLYPGGAREVCRRRGEGYAVHWKENVDFVRAALKFNAVIVPFSAIGADDSVSILLDAEEQLQLPIIGELIRTQVLDRFGMDYEHLHPITTFPRPIRFYFKFHKPIELDAMKDAGREQALYELTRSQVEAGINELLEYRTRQEGIHAQRSAGPLSFLKDISQGWTF